MDKKKLRVGFKSGRWEIIHRGHIECLEKCAQLCDKLIVLIHDSFHSPSYIDAEDRAYILEQLSFVTSVHIYKEDTENIKIAQLTDGKYLGSSPYSDPYYIMFHSEELAGQDIIPGSEFVDNIVFVPRHRINGKNPKEFDSTTEIVEKIMRTK